MRASLGVGLTLQAAPCCPHFASRFCKKLPPELLLLGLHPNPALLFLIAEKEGKKASTPGSHKIYFYPGILQLPTVGQVKCLYYSVKNKFYRRLQRGALNSKGKSWAENGDLFYAVRASTRIIVCRLFFQICAVWAGFSRGAVWLNAT